MRALGSRLAEILEGETVVWFGERVESHVSAGAGDFVYIPPNVAHVPINVSDTHWAKALVARTGPNASLLPHRFRIDDHAVHVEDDCLDHRHKPTFRRTWSLNLGIR